MPAGESGDPSPAGERWGAYGLGVTGIGRDLLLPADPEWPALEVVRRLGRSTRTHDRLGGDRAELVLANGGDVVIERAPGRAVFTMPFEVDDEALAHPYLAPVAAIAAYWHGRESLHAGAVAVGDTAWGVLGEREAGKSSLLAWLAATGHPVLSDDIVVTDGSLAFAGPRSIDLRAEAAAELGVGEPRGVVGARERWRVALEPIAATFELQGWIFLAWGSEVSVTHVAPGAALTRLAEQRAMRVPPTDPSSLLRFAALPAWELRRPREWSALPESAQKLLQTIG